MKKIILTAVMSLAISGAAAADEAQVVKMKVKEVSYMADIHQAKDGSLLLEPKTEWDGVRVVMNGSVCLEETQKVVRLDEREKLGGKYQVPVVERNSKEIPCPY